VLFQQLPDVTVAAGDLEGVRKFFGFADWPDSGAQIVPGDQSRVLIAVTAAVLVVLIGFMARLVRIVRRRRARRRLGITAPGQ
jgi:hypothetical protein